MTSEPVSEHQDEAEKLLASRVEDFRAFLAMDDAGEGDDDLGSVYDYGLSWEKVITNHRDGTTTWEHLLSTGGPHDHFELIYEANGTLSGWRFIYLPWFDRVEIEDGSALVEPADRAIVNDFYQTFFYAEEGGDA